MALSTISHTRWCRPEDPTPPMYMPGRLRTGSRPSRTVMSFAVYFVAIPLLRRTCRFRRRPRHQLHRLEALQRLAPLLRAVCQLGQMEPALAAVLGDGDRRAVGRVAHGADQ